MNKVSVSIILSCICIFVYLASLIFLPNLLGFVPDTVFLFKLILCIFILLPAIVFSIISRKQLAENGKSTKSATVALIIGLTTTLLVSGVTYGEYINNRKLRNSVLGASTKSLIKNTCVAMEMLKLKCGKYPSESEGFLPLIQSTNHSCWSGPYMPVDTEFIDAWENPIKYTHKKSTMVVSSSGPDGEFNTNDDITCN